MQTIVISAKHHFIGNKYQVTKIYFGESSLSFSQWTLSWKNNEKTFLQKHLICVNVVACSANILNSFTDILQLRYMNLFLLYIVQYLIGQQNEE